MRVFDGFTFFNELDLLEIRLAELSPVVDRFVLVEAPVTFQGARKPLHYAENRARFARWEAQIDHVVVSDMPATDDPWVRERFQREAIRRGLPGDLTEADRVMVSDLDEIPRRSVIETLRARGGFSYLEQALFIYHLNWAALDWPGPPWTRAYSLPGPAFEALPNLSEPRERTPADFLGGEAQAQAAIVRGAGWHFSYLGGVAGMMAKLGAYSHSEPEVARWKDEAALKTELQAQRHFVNGAALTTVPVDASFPVLVRSDEARWWAAGLLA